MTESTPSTSTQGVVDASSIPSEMLPLLAEMAQADSEGQFIALALPADQTIGDDVIIEGTTQTTSPIKNYVKSRRKRKKMEIYVRNDRKFVHIGDQMKRWDQYRKELRVKSDQEFAKLLLDGFRKYTKVVQLVVGPTLGFPEIGNTDKSSLQPKVELKGESDSDDLEDFIQEVQDGLARGAGDLARGAGDGPNPDGASQDKPQNGEAHEPLEVDERSTKGQESSDNDEQMSPDDQRSSGET